LWEKGILRESEDECWVQEAIVLHITTPYTNTEIAKELNITSVLDNTKDYNKKLDRTCKQNSSQQINEDNKKTHSKSRRNEKDHRRDFMMMMVVIMMMMMITIMKMILIEDIPMC
jgi:ABC-type Na+ efflux pump permease subunit